MTSTPLAPSSRVARAGRDPLASAAGRSAIALALYLLTTVLVFLSLIGQIDSAVLLEPADLTSTARDYWAAERLGQTPFSLEQDTLLYAPEGQSRAPAIQIANFVQPAFVWVTKPFLGFLGALNVYMLLGFAISAWAMFALLDRLRLHIIASFFGGLVFGFSWWQFEQAFYGHVGLNQIWIFPLLVLTLLRLRSRRDFPSALAVGATLGLAFYLFSYLGLFAAGLVSVFALLDVLDTRREGRGRALVAYAIAATATLAALFPALLAAAILPSGFTSSFPTPKVSFFGANLTDYVIPSSHHPLLGAFASFLNGDRPHVGENVVFFGYAVIALAIMSGVGWRRFAREREALADRAFTLRFAAVLIPFGILMSLPAYAGVGDNRIPLPDGAYVIGTALNWWKIYSRFGILAGFGLAILAAFALHVLLQHRRAALLVSAICALALVELFPYMPNKVTWLGDPEPVVSWLAKQPEGTVAHYPMTLDWRTRDAPDFGAYAWQTVYDQTQHGHPLYAVPSLRPDGGRREAIRLLTDDLERPFTPGVLRAEGVRYVVVHDDVYRSLGRPPPKPARGLALRARFPGHVSVYSVEAEPTGDLEAVLDANADLVAAERGLGRPELTFTAGVNPTELYQGKPARWMTQNATLRFRWDAPGYCTSWRLVVRAFSNGVPRQLELRDSHDNVLGQAVVDTIEGVHSVATFTLTKDVQKLRLVASPGPTWLGDDTRLGSIFLADVNAFRLAYCAGDN